MRSIGLKDISQKEKKFKFFGYHDLDLDLMTFVLKHEVNRSIYSKVMIRRQMDRQTDRHV